MKPFGLIADLHLHNWQAFSDSTADGINGRLDGLLAELGRCGSEVKKSGGDTIYIAGDVFHARGSIAPSVLNPALDVFDALYRIGIRVRLIPGNHDLEGKHSTRLSSAVTALEGVGVEACHKPQTFCANDDRVVVVPWFESIADLKEELEAIAITDKNECDLILHAPIDGTLPGIPAHGLSPEYLAKLGFKRVFAGHYHHHKDFGNGVYSIGALAHHTWSDVGSKAGFLIVGEGFVEWRKSHLPEFIDLDKIAELDEAEVPLMVEGNFVRAKVETSKMSEIEELRASLMGHGAKGVIIQSVKKAEAKRDGAVVASVSAGASLEASLAEFVRAQSFPDAARVETECQKVLAEAGV